MSDQRSAAGRIWQYELVVLATAGAAIVVMLIFCIFYFRRQRRGRDRLFIVEGFVDMSPLPQGLRRSFRERLPTIVFDESLSSSMRIPVCSICLNDYQSNEKLLRLPSCEHSFHSECVNAWLEKNSTCPLCRRCCGQDSFDDHCAGVENGEALLAEEENGRVEERDATEGWVGIPIDKEQHGYEEASSSGEGDAARDMEGGGV